MSAQSERLPMPLPRSAIGRMLSGLRAFRKLIDNPADPLHGPIFQMCVEHALMRSVARSFERHEEGRTLLAERPRLNAKTVSLATMGGCPARSLGQAYAAYFEANAITPFDPPALPVDTPADYVATRLREVHDVFHVVTGYGTDDLGELELQWFNCGNVGFGPLPILVLVSLFVMGRMSRYGGLWSVGKRARAAYRRGRRSRSFASIPWEQYWQMPLRELQALVCAPAEEVA